jgi:hypothetical protein
MSLERIIEELIQSAIAAGEFDNLSGKGRPLDLEGYFQTPEHLRMGYSILKAGQFAPQEVQLLKDIEELESQLLVCREPEEQARLKRLIQEKIVGVNLLLEKHRQRRRSGAA